MIRDALRALLGWSKPPALPLTPAMPPKGSCVECGAPGAHAAHLVPRVAGGTRTFPLCESCHGKSHDLDFHDHKQLSLAGQRRAYEVEGKWAGRVPFGYRSQGGYLTREPHEQWVLAQIERLSAEGVSSREIASWLNTAIRPVPDEAHRWTGERVSRLRANDRSAVRRKAEAHIAASKVRL